MSYTARKQNDSMTTENIQPPPTLDEAPSGRVSSGPSLGSLIESLAFESKQPDRGYTVRASYLKEPRKQDALIEIFKDSKPLRAFFFPAYKVWNIAAHFHDIVDGEIAGDSSGYEMAAWNGITNSIILLPRVSKPNIAHQPTPPSAP